MTNESKRDWENFFKVGELDYSEEEFRANGCPADYTVHIANAIIRKELAKTPMVYGCDAIPSGLRKWYVDTIKEDTHTAKLIQIEEIKRDPISDPNKGD